MWQSSPNELLWADYGDEHVAYCSRSGKTHLLNDASYRLLTEILLEPRSSAEIAQALAETGDEGLESGGGKLDSVLRHLESLGLISRL